MVLKSFFLIKLVDDIRQKNGTSQALGTDQWNHRFPMPYIAFHSYLVLWYVRAFLLNPFVFFKYTRITVNYYNLKSYIKLVIYHNFRRVFSSHGAVRCVIMIFIVVLHNILHYYEFFLNERMILKYQLVPANFFFILLREMSWLNECNQ